MIDMEGNELLIEFSKFKGEVTTKLDRAVSDIAEMRLETSKVMEAISKNKIDKDEVYRHWKDTDQDHKDLWIESRSLWKAVNWNRWLLGIGAGILTAVELYIKFVK